MSALAGLLLDGCWADSLAVVIYRDGVGTLTRISDPMYAHILGFASKIWEVGVRWSPGMKVTRDGRSQAENILVEFK